MLQFIRYITKKKRQKTKMQQRTKKKRKKKETKSLNFPKRYETKLPGLEGNFFFWHTENFFKIFTQVTQFPNSSEPICEFDAHFQVGFHLVFRRKLFLVFELLIKNLFYFSPYFNSSSFFFSLLSRDLHLIRNV